ncbi:hypothetical protein A2955_05270 [Candidatus Woesebacteria bacterium RIFCSPLOWO2_01_FULL_37_19]|uniref:Uncharacterized protein n=2 Tax=Candidatus Woeseibacteriota TaxID=1752722 RepID=A0A1F8AZ41_9BACT|nr:MAG: hypothetical protein A2771_01400 [Candidatus Woesebacteria bacterium RIFCSPHIGHO2_01_FULL_38_26b]OGM56996.1 MAG: hypothetical protein A2955_05270 [Candidatus Woesebacteria bacterium RIFCSPLOWO2_01_FULL_37_19]
MTSELGERFRYKGGEEMNGYFICKELTDPELEICYSLVNSGPLGMSMEGINEEGLIIPNFETLVKEGLVRKSSTFQLAKRLVRNNDVREKVTEWVQGGGRSALENSKEMVLFDSFYAALKIVSEGKTEKNLQKRYQVIPVLYDYMNLIYV